MRRSREEATEQAVRVRRLLDDVIDVEALYTTKTTVVFRGRPRVPMASVAMEANARLASLGLQATVEQTTADVSLGEDVLVTVQFEPSKERAIPWMNIGLLALTLVTVYFAQGFDFMAWFMAILLFHEFGHFIWARRHRLDVSWPYFLPAPPVFILGTFGAFIRLRSPIHNRRALFDMAVAGPLAGLIVAVCALFVGLPLSTVVNTTEPTTGIILGESLLFKAISAITMPSVGPEQTILLHPIAFAGWAGLIVTMLNLLPMGQLDGGHIAYALFPRLQRWIALVVIATLFIVGIWWPWWLFWAIIGLVLRPQHPPTVVDEISLGPKRRAIGYFALALFVLCFTPVPFSL